MGTPEFSVPSLEYLINSKHKVVCVYTQPSKKKSRGQKIRKTPVHIFSEKNGINVIKPKNILPAVKEKGPI